MKHTPGPWFVSRYDTRVMALDEVGPIAKADCGGVPHEVAEANAQLIAAAPDLLNVLTKLYLACTGRGPQLSAYEVGEVILKAGGTLDAPEATDDKDATAS